MRINPASVAEHRQPSLVIILLWCVQCAAPNICSRAIFIFSKWNAIKQLMKANDDVRAVFGRLGVISLSGKWRTWNTRIHLNHSEWAESLKNDSKMLNRECDNSGKWKQSRSARSRLAHVCLSWHSSSIFYVSSVSANNVFNWMHFSFLFSGRNANNNPHTNWTQSIQKEIENHMRFAGCCTRRDKWLRLIKIVDFCAFESSFSLVRSAYVLKSLTRQK